MFPGVDGFAWDAGHFIFLGAFFSVLLALIASLTRAAWRVFRPAAAGTPQNLRWHADFSELPCGERKCRHELAGEIDSRMCPNEFDCRACADHPRFVSAKAAGQLSKTIEDVAGMCLPLDRSYHRAHTWARPESDGTYTIGLDEIGSAVLGHADVLLLPPKGSRVVVNGPAWTVRKKGDTVRVLSPLDGEVVDANGDGEWCIRVKPDPGALTTHLLAGREAVCWFRSEFERLQAALSDSGLGAALADGGALVEDLEVAYPKADWQGIRGGVFLEP